MQLHNKCIIHNVKAYHGICGANINFADFGVFHGDNSAVSIGMVKQQIVKSILEIAIIVFSKL
jgi:hypothetical protein